MSGVELLLVGFGLAVLLRIFWRAVLNLVLIGAAAVIFAGVIYVSLTLHDLAGGNL